VVHSYVMQLSPEPLELTCQPERECPVQLFSVPGATWAATAHGPVRPKQLIDSSMPVTEPGHVSCRRHQTPLTRDR